MKGGGASLGCAVLARLGFWGFSNHSLVCCKKIHHAVRMAQYLKVLAKIDDGKKFYSESFKADSWSSAKELLSWRDELVMAGWLGRTIQGGLERLDTFCLVEAEANPELIPGVGDRLHDVIGEAEKRDSSGDSLV